MPHPVSDTSATLPPDLPHPAHPTHSAHPRHPGATSEPHSLSCMEVWGGNDHIDSSIAVPGLVVHVYSRPYHGAVAGGDVLYVSTCGSGRIARILVADVAGHGDDVASLARTLRDLMRRYINYVDQSAFVSALNHEFKAAATEGRFATAVVATYWSATDCVTATNAGHPRPVWYCARSRTWTVLADPTRLRAPETHSNLPLGVVDLAGYDQVLVRLAAGDVLLVYTDSIIEASDPAGVMLGEVGLVRLLGRLDAERPEMLVQSVVEHVEAFRGGRESDDDLTVVAMVCSGEKPRRRLTEKLGAMALIGRAIASRLLGGHSPVPWPEMSVVNILGMFVRRANRMWGGRLTPGEIRTGVAARRADR